MVAPANWFRSALPGPLFHPQLAPRKPLDETWELPLLWDEDGGAGVEWVLLVPDPPRTSPLIPPFWLEMLKTAAALARWPGEPAPELR